MPMNVFGTVNLCQVYSKSIVEFRSLKLSKTFYCWPNAVSKVSGKVKCAICRCGERKKRKKGAGAIIPANILNADHSSVIHEVWHNNQINLRGDLRG